MLTHMVIGFRRKSLAWERKMNPVLPVLYIQAVVQRADPKAR